jgi:hypothetical protein
MSLDSTVHKTAALKHLAKTNKSNDKILKLQIKILNSLKTLTKDAFKVFSKDSLLSVGQQMKLCQTYIAHTRSIF